MSLGRSESQGWILLLVTRRYKNCKKGRKNKAGLDWRASNLLLWDWTRTFGTFEQNIYALCSKAEPCPSAGSAMHWGKLVKLIAIIVLGKVNRASTGGLAYVMEGKVLAAGPW